MSGYPIPAGEYQVEERFRNSRFIGTVAAAVSVAAARAFVDQVRARFADASHHVYAFAVGYGAAVTHGMSDAGEPAGTAGRPTLAVLQGADLGDVVLVTTRYFGGTRLGTGGLVRAYTATAQAALAGVPRTRRVELVAFRAQLPYELYQTCRRLLTEQGASLTDERFGAAVDLTGQLPADAFEAAAAALMTASAGRVHLQR